MTMIERVALAIQEAEATHENGTPWVEHVARAAIAAMREPTEGMRDAGFANNFQRYADAGYQAMIDAALNEEH